ncbi:hypothetical protein [Acinetobacter gerneri]|uniref:hypothetical protein n=1 Tax=Acinetobacter gerneri TaxID=202952 RepID=UPI003212D14E
MNFIQAKEIALKELTEISNYLGEKCIFFKTYEVKDKGWVFSYNTEEYDKLFENTWTKVIVE